MRLARVLGVIGRGLISAGVIVLLFVAYQLWGTGLQHSAAQNNLENDFEEATGITLDATDEASLEQLADRSRQERAAVPTPDPEAAEDPLGGAALVESDLTTVDQSIQAKLYPEAGESFARINIPDIGVDQIVVAGVSVEDLRKGPGHYRTTPNPGQAGNAAIAGHRTTYGAPFHRVDELQPGDPIFVTTAQGIFKYEVLGFDNPAGGPELGYFIVSPSDTWVLDQIDGENTLTLTACHPKYSARQRIIVQAELVGEPAPTIPRDDAAELGAVTLESGASDEQAASFGTGTSVPVEETQVIGDDVAADDDPTVDAEGNPLDSGESDDSADAAEDESNDDTSGDAAGQVGSTNGESAEGGDDADTTDAQAESGDASLVAASESDQTPFSEDPDDFGEGLNGDPTKVQPAIMWGLAGLMIWVASWFMGMRLGRKWTLYAVGLLPFAFVLWSTFVNVDQALPSY